MKGKGKTKIFARSREDGIVAMEFVILFPLFFLILTGIVEFGHLFYVRHTLTNASREGARAGVMFYPDLNNRISWARSQATTTVRDYLGLNDGETPVLPGVTVTVPDPEISGSGSGSTLKVTVNASNVALVLGDLIPAFADLTVSAETTMKLE